MSDQFTYLEFNGIRIAVSIESHTNDKHVGYQAENILFYVERGQMNIRYQNKLYIIKAGECCLVKKFTDLEYFKTWTEEEGYAIVSAMALKDDFIKEAISELSLSRPKKDVVGPVLLLKKNAVLAGLYTSLNLYLVENEEPDEYLMYLKTKEALLGIIRADPNYLAFFYEFSKPVKAEIEEFMRHHKYTNISLEKLASLSGRSLSTFNRDFRIHFEISPHRWILLERLKKAKELLSIENKRPTEIYLDLGFKDLGHFSRSFKKEFGVSPSKI